jgi:hypothetical protein
MLLGPTLRHHWLVINLVRSRSMVMEHHFSRDISTGKINPRLCKMCAAVMVSTRIAPARLGINARTFECQQCNYVEKVLEAADPIQSNVLGWLFGELKPPT